MCLANTGQDRNIVRKSKKRKREMGEFSLLGHYRFWWLSKQWGRGGYWRIRSEKGQAGILRGLNFPCPHPVTVSSLTHDLASFGRNPEDRRQNVRDEVTAILAQERRFRTGLPG